MTTVDSPTTLPAGLRQRPVRMADVVPITDLVNAASTHDWGGPEASEQNVRGSYESPNFELDRDSLLVEDEAGRPLAVAEIYDHEPDHNRAFLFLRIHPRCPDRTTVAEHLLAWAGRRGALVVEHAGPGLRVILESEVSGRDSELATAFERARYSLVRHSWQMEIEFQAPPQPPTWPQGISVRSAVAGQDERAVYDADTDAFRDHWGFTEGSYETWLFFKQKLSEYDPSLWFLAMDGDEIAGISLCTPSRADDQTMGWVNDLGVRRQWRKRGVGIALLQHSFVELHRRGKTSVGLGVDSQSLTGATRLYERAGMHQARQYDQYEKELRPGRDPRTLELSTSDANPG